MHWNKQEHITYNFSYFRSIKLSNMKSFKRNIDLKSFLFSCLFFVISISVFCQDMHSFRMYVDTLASVSFSGRGYVNDGIKKAADFIINEYKTLDLLPFGNEYRQQFKIDINTFPGKMELALNNEKLVPGKDFLIDPASPPVCGTFETYNIEKADLLNDKTIGLIQKKSKNKFLVIDERNYKSINSTDDKKINEVLNLLKYNKHFVTSGTVIITSEKLTWSPAPIQVSKPVFIVRTDIAADKIETISVSADANYIKGYETSNIIGYVKGTSVPDSFLVVTAHYDHLGMMGSGVFFPGANDNASGVSMLLNLARHYSLNPHKYSIVFIALSAEEVDLLGAQYFTSHSLFDLSKTEFLINFDLAGTGDEGIKVVNATVFPDEFGRLVKINDAGKYLSSVQSRGEACISDHCLFYQKKVPCFYIYTLGGIKAYHDIYDKPETLPLTEIEDYYKLMVEFFDSF